MLREVIALYMSTTAAHVARMACLWMAVDCKCKIATRRATNTEERVKQQVSSYARTVAHSFCTAYPTIATAYERSTGHMAGQHPIRSAEVASGATVPENPAR